MKVIPFQKVRNEKYADGKSDDPDGIVLLSFLQKALGAGLFRLSLGHQFDHSGEGRVFRALADRQFDAAALVDRSSKKLAAEGLGNGHRFTREGRFIHVGATFCDDAVYRDLFARPNDNDLAHFQIFDRDLFGFARAFDQGLAGPQGE